MPEVESTVLVVVAHPDDETIFFGGLIRDTVRAGGAVDVICATGEFGNERITGTRRAEFRRACRLLGASPIHFDLADRPGPLEVEALAAGLRAQAARRSYARIYTHGVWGEYGHRHHSDVCRTVHREFQEGVFCLAGPLAPTLARALTPEDFASKRRIAASAYPSQWFARDWCSAEERFVRLARREVAFLAAVLDAEGSADPGPAFGEPLDPRLEDLLRLSLEGFAATAPPFAELAHIPPSVWRATCRRRHQLLATLLGE